MKIYIVAEATSTSGGPESLQQLAFFLRKNGYESYIYYIDTKDKNTPEKFKQYNNEISTEIEDNHENIIIVPESYTELLYQYKSIKKVIWWLSLDFYLNNRWIRRTKIFCRAHKLPMVLFPVSFIYLFMSNKLKRHLYKYHRDDGVFHLYNCEYVNRYLSKIGVSSDMKMYLCGPLRNEFFKQFEKQERLNNVLYNPKKGIEFTKKLISNCKNKKIKFIPIQNMTPKEIRNLMKVSKVYIDFGYFPGPERIPREAVMSGCNIITSKEGSAANNIDVPIPKEFKFTPTDDNITLILECIELLMLEYDSYYNFFDEYRTKVIKQYEEFEDRIIKMIKLME